MKEQKEVVVADENSVQLDVKKINYRSQQTNLIKNETDANLFDQIQEKLDILSRDHFAHYDEILKAAEAKRDELKSARTKKNRAVEKQSLTSYINQELMAVKSKSPISNSGLQIGLATSYVFSVGLMAKFLSQK